MLTRMDRLSSLVFVGIAILVMAIPFQSLEINSQVDTSSQTTASISLIYSYGVDSKNILDTFRGTFTKDMVVDPPITIWMSISSEEIQMIEAKLEEIGFFGPSYKELLPSGLPIGQATPYSTYYLKVLYNGILVRELRWSDETIYSNGSTKLYELCRLIKDIIVSKPDYKRLPQARAGYC